MKLCKVVVTLFLFLSLTACANAPISKEVQNTQAQSQITNESSTEYDNSSYELKHDADTCSIIIGDVSLSICESKQSILSKLDEVGLSYGQIELDNPTKNQYDSFYHVGAWLQIYFLNDECVRLRMINVDEGSELACTTEGISPGSTYSKMVELYGDSFESHSYFDQILYTIYRYSINDCVYEFAMQGENTDSIYNVDIYLPSQAPIYEYGEEIQKN